MVNNELKHYGVLGMHWGVHKANTETAKGVEGIAKRSKYSKERKEAAKMSDEELKKKVDRMSLEDKYANLKANDSKVVKGAAYTQDVLRVVGGAAAIGVTAWGLYTMLNKKNSPGAKFVLS